MEITKEFFNKLKKFQLHNDVTKEIVLVHSRVKSSTRITFSESLLTTIQKFLGEYGLCMEESGYRIVAKRDRGKGGWKNKTLRVVSPESGEGDPIYYIAGSNEILNEIGSAEFSGNSSKFGQLLGYPKCCQDFFKKYFRLANEKQCDFVLHTLSETKGDYPYDFHNNYASRYFGYSLLSHFPCSFNCRESSDLAERYYNALKKYSKKWADMFPYHQKSAIVYTEYSGVFLIKNFGLEGDVLKFLRHSDSYFLSGTIVNDNSNLLRKSDNILIDSRNNFSARKGERVLKTFKGENVGLLVFEQ